MEGGSPLGYWGLLEGLLEGLPEGLPEGLFAVLHL